MDDAEAWKNLARCRNLPLSSFFPSDRAKAYSKAYQAEVKELREQYCWQCPVRVTCFEYAMSNEHSRAHGVWAGTTPTDRLSFIQIRCRCGRTIDPFDLVQGDRFRCRPCLAQVD